MNEKTFIILGMHKSATSLIAGGLNNFGVNMGEKLMGGDEWNKIGYFEDMEFFRLNEEILKAAGGSWYEPPSERKILALKKEFGPKIKKLVEKKSGLWGWKDPRTTLTIKLYLPYLKNPHFICCFRDPKEVARSLSKTQGISTEKALKLAGIYNKRLLKFLKEVYENSGIYYLNSHRSV